MQKACEIRTANCRDLLRKYQIHDGIVSDNGKVGVITIRRKLFSDTLWHILREYCVLNVNESISKFGITTEISVGIATT